MYTALVAAEPKAPTRRKLAEVLAHLNFRVGEVQADNIFVSRMGEERPNLVILDLDLPGAAAIVRQVCERATELPVLVLTTHERAPSVRRAVRCGADYIVKPIDAQVLQRRIQGLLALVPQPTMNDAATRIRTQLPELHNADTGRIDAAAVAHYLELPLKQLAGALDANYPSVHKTPDAPALQEKLALIKRSLAILSDAVGDRKTILAWLNSPHEDLGMKTPKQVILDGQADALRTMLENSIAGIPS